ncbi:kinase [Erythrobacter arachoides]|uniref:Kinase n=1 Tax=Aurantiacibacter arachoides TaxID=1850444 RepID=A0A845A265_9SPHN|nr:kinase [Aurantiacibacter arachoides]MXO93670.1 kinase [Aurantiacibacter arachoides]GGD47595.1 kinase [Aurantiacibacter arachoides]
MTDAGDPVAALIAAEGLPHDYAEVVARDWQPLATLIARRAAGRTPLIVGINGAQGSGKTTLCRFLELLLKRRGLRAVTLSIDDLYLPRAERVQLAEQVHPLFATRGVPGTHSPALGMAVIEAVLAGRAFTLPRFDKAMDDRAPGGTNITGPVDVLLFEGWCVGASPQEDAALAKPVNALEAEHDADGTWRRLVNLFLREDYARLFAQVDMLVMLQVGSFADVRRNRALQEDKLRAGQPDAPGIMAPEQVERFLDHYERLTLHMAADLPARADVVIPIGPDQRPL